MPYATSEFYEQANKERFHLIYQTQSVAAAEVVTITLNKDCNFINVTTTAGIGTCRLVNAAALAMFDTTVVPNVPASIFVGTGTITLTITNSAISTLGVSQMAVWGDFS